MEYLKSTVLVMFVITATACTDDLMSESSSKTKGDQSALGSIQAVTTDERVSELGRYEGYSKPVYKEYIRSSVYVPMRDGVKLAVDIFRPAVGGVTVSTKLPVLLQYSRYWRARERSDGSIKTGLGIIPPGENSGELTWSFEESTLGDPYLLSHGYVLVRADARGTGASQGIYDGEYSMQESIDAYDLVEWLGEQPYTNGKVGMYGGSYVGSVQYGILRQDPPSALKAIFPRVALLDPYQTWLSGAGVYRKGIITNWLLVNMSEDGVLDDNNIPERKKVGRAGEVARVDGDIDGKMLAAAVAERRSTRDEDYFLRNAFDVWDAETEQTLRDLKDALGIETDIDLVRLIYGPTDILAKALKEHPQFVDRLVRATRAGREVYSNLPDNFPEFLPQINASGVPIYNWGGWRDVYADATPLWYVNLETPKKLTMGPWSHSPKETDDPREDAQRVVRTIEQLRWFDYHLKDIDNGIMDEPEVHYAVNYSPSQWEWCQDSQWPPSGSQHKSFYFADGPSGSISSVNDGKLSRTAQESKTRHAFKVDYTTTMGTQDRYYDAISGIFKSVDLIQHAETALTYTTPPLDHDLVIAGHPIVHLQASSSASDGDFLVYLEEVDADGSVHFLTDGLMRGSYRTLGTPSYDYLNMPWSMATANVVDVTPPLNTGVSSLEFPLKPVANRFEEGHRIRVVITGADSDGTLQIPRSPTPTQILSIGGLNPSRIELPVVN